MEPPGGAFVFVYASVCKRSTTKQRHFSISEAVQHAAVVHHKSRSDSISSWSRRLEALFRLCFYDNNTLSSGTRVTSPRTNAIACTEFPSASILGWWAAIPPTPGSTHHSDPETPDLAGSPTSEIQSPEIVISGLPNLVSFD